MEIILVAVGLILVSGLVSLLLGRHPAAASIISVVGIVLGCLIGLVISIVRLIGGTTESISWPWSVPGGNFAVGIDPLSALFLVVIFGVSIPVSVYGASYLWRRRMEHSLGSAWFFTSVLIASMAVVVVAQNAVLFLIAWEVMSLSSFFLVMFEGGTSEIRAGWTYLIATHLGTAFLLVLFILLGHGESFDFSQFSPGTHAGLLLILSLVGFGTKAGIMPLHVWLPEAHPAAPSHISALMSGVMIKMGVYGVIRTITFLGPPPDWWGWLLLGIGLSSGVLGVLFAIAQHDLKRLLAYHSVENIGIIFIGLGVGLLGITLQAPMLTVLGFGGGLLHVVNHALFKGLLFLGAGSVAHATGTREIDKLGGLLKRMPWTGVTFLIGSIAICGLPPLNGFISEFLIYMGALHAGITLRGGMAVSGVLVIMGLALIGALAVACFTKACGVVFLGHPRSQQAADSHEAGPAMIIPMVILAAACVLVGLFAPLGIRVLLPVIAEVSRMPVATIEQYFTQGTTALVPVAIASAILLALVALIVFWRIALLRRKKVTESVTWDCGYSQPSTRMQYTASSFAHPITDMFRGILGTRKHEQLPEGVFPKAAKLETNTPDVFEDYLFQPIFTGIQRGLGAFRWLQHGNVHLYILYILITLLLLLFWKLQ